MYAMMIRVKQAILFVTGGTGSSTVVSTMDISYQAKPFVKESTPGLTDMSVVYRGSPFVRYIKT